MFAFTQIIPLFFFLRLCYAWHGLSEVANIGQLFFFDLLGEVGSAVAYFGQAFQMATRLVGQRSCHQTLKNTPCPQIYQTSSESLPLTSSLFFFVTHNYCICFHICCRFLGLAWFASLPTPFSLSIVKLPGDGSVK